MSEPIHRPASNAPFYAALAVLGGGYVLLVLLMVLANAFYTSPDEVLAITGYAVGTVGPFALHQSVPIIVDKSVLAYDEVSIGSGVRGTALILRSADLLDALGAVDVVDLRDET